MAENDKEQEENIVFEEETVTKTNGLISICILLSVIFTFLPSLLVFLFVNKQKLSPFEYKSNISLLNFEVYFTIIAIAFGYIFSLIKIPVFGVFIKGIFYPALLFINLIICIKALQAFNKGKEYVYPISSPLSK